MKRRRDQLPLGPINNDRVAADVGMCRCWECAPGVFVRRAACSVHLAARYRLPYLSRGER